MSYPNKNKSHHLSICGRRKKSGGGPLVGLALDAEVHDVVPADGAVVDLNVPRPKRDTVPLRELSPNVTALMSRENLPSLLRTSW